MAEWTTCPGCQLKHTRRPDGVCPRCKRPLDDEATPAEQPPLRATDAFVPAPARPVALGSLSQSARSKQLGSARGILLFVGVLTVIVNGVFLYLAQKSVDEAIEAEIKKLPAGYVADPDKVAEVREQGLRALRLFNGGGMVLGVIFVACGLLVTRYPVPATVTGLVLYLGGNAVFMYLDPSTMARGLPMKVIIVIALFKAVQAAIAYQKDASDAPAA
jgi:hypothetical protein